jgi:hypothetical protein
MAQADYVVANGTGAAVRSDLNGQLAAIVSNNSGVTEPATMYAYQWWADTTTGELKQRNSANNAWITIGTLADANLGLLSLAGGTLTGALLADDSGTAALPAIAFDGDTNTGIFRAGADQFGIATNGVERVEFGTSEVVFNDGGANYDFRIEGDTNSSLFFVDASAEAVGIGTTSPSCLLNTQSSSAGELARFATSANSGEVNISVGFTTANQFKVGYDIGSGDGILQTNVSGASLLFKTVSTERGRFDSSGRLLVGTSSARSNFAGNTSTPLIQTEGTTAGTSSASIVNNSAGVVGSTFNLSKTRATSVGGNTVVVSGDEIGIINFQAADGTNLLAAASIQAAVDGTPGANDMPGRLVFSTTADNASSPTERMRIESTGRTGLFVTAQDGFEVSSSAAAGTVHANFIGRASGTTTFGGTNTILIFNNGNIINTNNSYGQISDVKLKENIIDANSQWNDLKSVRVRNFNFKEGQTHRQIGVIAQELEEASPGLVYETPDRDEDGNETGEVTKGVNYSVLYMKAVKALQEAMERIEALEAKVTALEAQ